MIEKALKYLHGLTPAVTINDGPFCTVVFGNGTKQETGPAPRFKPAFAVGNLADFADLVKREEPFPVIIVGNGIKAHHVPSEYSIDTFVQEAPFYSAALPPASMEYDKFITWLEMNPDAITGRVGDKRISYAALMEAVKVVCYSENSTAKVESGGVQNVVTFTSKKGGDPATATIPSVLEAELPYGLQEFTTTLKFKLTMDAGFDFKTVLLNQIQAVTAYKEFAAATLKELLPGYPIYRV